MEMALIGKESRAKVTENTRGMGLTSQKPVSGQLPSGPRDKVLFESDESIFRY